MRDTHQEIIFGQTGQSLIWDAPEGRPSSVTSVTVQEATDEDDAADESATTGSASVETNPNTTFDAASGAGQTDPTKCNLTATTGIVRGRSYLATSAANGDREWVPVTAIVSADSAYSRVPLMNSYTTSDTFQSTRISISVDSTWVAASSNLSTEESPFPRYRAIWVYVVAGVTYRNQSFFDLTRYSARHTVSGPDVDERFPGWLDRLPVDYRREQGQAFIDQAARAVKMDMLAHGKASRWLRHLDVYNELVVYRACLMASEAGVILGVGTLDGRQAAKDAYDQRFKQLVVEPHAPLAVSPGGGFTDTAKKAPAWRR